ncbi:MAG: sulfatase [Acidobacteria bacterium]|nr:sulfatase [Acidobacteriota bacterium]
MINRRQFLGSLAAAPLAAQPTPARPNVVFISVDDMNDWVGCLGGYEGVQTPNIDKLAKRGVLFSNAHCASPLCNPSRTALFTGLSPATSGVYNNDQYWRPNLPQAVSLPSHFKANGYRTAGAGKIFHHTVGMNPPDQWDDFQLQQFDDPWYRRADWFPWNKKVPAPKGHPFNGLADFPGEFDWGTPPAADAEYGDMEAVRYAERFLKQEQTKPFFLAVGLWHPHIPMYSPKRFFDLYPQDDVRVPRVPEDDLKDIPSVGQELAAFRRVEVERIFKERKWSDAVRAYLAAISFADEMVGQVVRAIDQSPQAANTVVVFWSDNGWHLGEKRHWHKSTLWHRSTHVPLIMDGPIMRDRGRARRQPVSLLDLYPTMVDLCGLPARPQLEGISLKPQLLSSGANRRPAVITYLKGNHAAVTERYRYIRYHDGGEELYDRQADPNEWDNRAGDAKLTKVKADLAQWFPKSNADPVPERTAFEFDFSTHTYRRK